MSATRICPNLLKEIDSLLADGYRLDMIMPADDPREAIVSRNGESLRLRSVPPATARGLPGGEKGPPATAGGTDRSLEGRTQSQWIIGRAGMEYRDLIPDRLGGRVVASHIRIVEGGEVPDYVHSHKLQFQMIYCKTGWIRVVYEDQGPAFVLSPGDCVLQPPEISHRVLESSAGAEVIEVTAPAVHETWVDHDLRLPTGTEQADRLYQTQKFVRFESASARWMEQLDGSECADTGISDATGGLASARIFRMAPDVHSRWDIDKRKQFVFVLSGKISVRTAEAASIDLNADECCVLSEETAYDVISEIYSEILHVALPAE